MTLRELKPGQQGKVRSIACTQATYLKRLTVKWDRRPLSARELRIRRTSTRHSRAGTYTNIDDNYNKHPPLL